ncbi:MAG TPA: tyrosine-type recombinase/integrase [Acidimicrobiales bacterium]|nr:tyrosine-type recombinase/integrase [Acidimicrobiales bacterium]
MPKRPRGKRMRGGDGSFTVSGKAANGEGSLYREADGVWRATYRVPGESRPRRVRGRTRDEALRRRAVALTKALAEGPRSAATTVLSGSSTIAELAAWWLRTVAAVRVRPSSLGKYEDRVERITAWLGDVRIGHLRAEQVATWQSDLLGSVGAKTVADARAAFRSIMEEAVNLGLIATNPVDRVRPPKVRAATRRALTASEARAVVAAGADDRLGAAIALLFVQGWRVSEVLGLAWSDLDFDAGIATVSRASVYADGVGMMLGPPKTEGTKGRHLLTPVVVELLRRRRRGQDEERLRAGAHWQQKVYEDRPIDLVFTTVTGGLLLRQAVTKAVAAAAVAAGLEPTGLGTHAGRSTAITVLYAEEGLDLADVARHVGHASPSTTAGYVRHLGRRPQATAEAASRLLDPTSVEQRRDAPQPPLCAVPRR